METLNKISKIIEKVIDYFLVFAFGTMTIVYFSAVVARFILKTGIPWAEEYTRYINVAMVMLGSATVARYNDHTNISVLELAVKGQGKKVVFLIQHILTIIFFGAAAVIGFKFAATATHVSANMRISMSIVYNVMSVAFVLVTIQSIISILNILQTDVKELEEEVSL